MNDPSTCPKNQSGRHTFLASYAGHSDKNRYVIHGICVECQALGLIIVPLDARWIKWTPAFDASTDELGV